MPDYGLVVDGFGASDAGGYLLTDAGGAPCCCGGGGDCDTCSFCRAREIDLGIGPPFRYPRYDDSRCRASSCCDITDRFRLHVDAEFSYTRYVHDPLNQRPTRPPDDAERIIEGRLIVGDGNMPSWGNEMRRVRTPDGDRLRVWRLPWGRLDGSGPANRWAWTVRQWDYGMGQYLVRDVDDFRPFFDPWQFWTGFALHTARADWGHEPPADENEPPVFAHASPSDIVRLLLEQFLNHDCNRTAGEFGEVAIGDCAAGMSALGAEYLAGVMPNSPLSTIYRETRVWPDVYTTGIFVARLEREWPSPSEEARRAEYPDVLATVPFRGATCHGNGSAVTNYGLGGVNFAVIETQWSSDAAACDGGGPTLSNRTTRLYDRPLPDSFARLYETHSITARGTWSIHPMGVPIGCCDGARLRGVLSALRGDGG